MAMYATTQVGGAQTRLAPPGAPGVHSAEALDGRVLVWNASRPGANGSEVTREVLAQAAGLDPKDLAFTRGRFGKPRLELPRGLEFNVAHTRDVQVGACAWRRPLGIDIERRDRAISPKLASHVLSARERVALLEHDVGARQRVLMHAWTAKEALRKAQGWGLSRSLAAVEVDLRPGATPRFLAIDGSSARAERWRLLRPDLGLSGHEVALVVRTRGAQC